MNRLTAKHFKKELLELYDFYAHGKISRREFLKRAGQYTTGAITALTALNLLSPNYSYANQVDEEDNAITIQNIQYQSSKGNGTVNGYLVLPKNTNTNRFPSVLVVHENRGLNPYIKDVARRLAKAGFLALAPDGLSSLGGYPGNDDEGRTMQAKIDPQKLMNDFFAGYEFLKSRNDTNGKVGVVGFCYGGGVSNALAVAYPDLSAAVPFYGRQAAAEDVPRIRAPLLIHYAELDERINKGWPAYEAALKANNKVYEAFIYPETNHGFHNDTTPRYDKKAAELAWSRTIKFFKKYLQ